MRPAALILALSCVALAAAPGPLAADDAGGATAVLVVEGRVTSLGETAGEGGLSVVVVTVREGDRDHAAMLAPGNVLREIGFEIEPGDAVRARLLVPEDGSMPRVQKILNRTRGAMARLRTLRQLPLWDGEGRWQGSLDHGSGAGHRHRGGAGGRGR